MENTLPPSHNAPSLLPPRTARAILYSMWAVGLLGGIYALTQTQWASKTLELPVAFAYLVLSIVAELRPARMISGRSIALTHAVGILAFTSQGEGAFVPLILLLGVGFGIGSLIREYLRPSPPSVKRLLTRAGAETASVCTSFILAGLVFLVPGGEIPSGTIGPQDVTGGTLVIAYSMLYSGIVGIIFSVRQIEAGRSIDRADRLRMLSMIVLPALLSVFGGEAARSTDIFSQTLLYVCTLFILFLLSDLSNAEAKLRRDLVREQAMSSENERLYRLQTEQVDQLALLNRVVGSLGGTLVTDTLVEHLISSASILSRASGFAIYVHTADRMELNRSVGLGSDFTFKAPPPIHIPNTQSFNAGQPLVIENLSLDERAAALRAVKLDEKFRTLVEIPMIAGGELIGILCLYYTQEAVPNNTQIDLLRIFATQAAQALANARQYLDAIEAYQQRGERLLTLTWLSRTLSSSVDIQSMCEHIVDVVLLATGAEIGVVLLVEDFSGSARLRVGAQRGLKNPFIDMPKALNSIAPMIDPNSGTIIAYREDEVYGDLPFLSSHSQTILICPMVQGGLLLGAIWLETSSATAFNAEEVQFVEQISHQSLIVLENARLFQRIESDRDQLATLLDTMEEGLMMVNRQGRIVIANPQMSLIGVDADALISRSYFECIAAPGLELYTQLGFVSLQDAERAIRQLHQDSGENVSVEYNLPSESGIKHIERRRVPIYSDNGEWLGVILVFYDRTVQYELERSREELTHMIVHDLRSPLTTVTTSLRLINTTIPKDTPYWSVVESTTEVSHRAIRKILNRVNSMLDIAKMQSGKLALNYEQVDLIPLVQGVLNDMSPIAVDMQVRIELQASQNSMMLTADADKIERVVMNLVDNALKYSPSDGVITVRIDHNGTSDRIKVDVVDEGPGVPAEYKTKLFESFMQIEGSRPRRGGVGLGLTFCKLVVDAHRGQLWVEDNPGGGSIFSLTLPTHTGTI